MSVSFDRINARDYRYRCHIFNQLKAVSNARAGADITHFKTAVEEGFCRVKDPVANDSTIVYPLAFRTDKIGATQKVRYTTLFTFNGGYYLIQVDPTAAYFSRGWKVVACVKLTSQQFSNFLASFAYDAGRQFGYQDAQMDRPNVEVNNPAPNNDAEAYQSGQGEQIMPAVIGPIDYARTGPGVGGQIGFASNYSTRIPAPVPPNSTSFVQAIAQVEKQAEEIYQ